MSDEGQNKEQTPLDILRHSTAHVMAKAVQRLFPGSMLGIGPPIENGFYYDIDVPAKQLSEEDFPAIEEEMRKIIAADEPFVRREVPRDEAIAENEARGEKYKVEIVRDLPEGEVTSFYDTGSDWTDLCRGPHVPSTGHIKAFKLLSVAGAYWRGDEKRPMLQRLYGTAWPSQEELDQYLERLEEARRRDHRRIGRDLGLFTFSDLVGPGLPLWLPKGATIRRELERYVTDLELRRGYQHVITPDVAKVDMYKTSGHWAHYQDGMFPVMRYEEEELVLRPMNCPHHIQIYRHEQRSYRELPLRLAEFGTMWRFEKSGELSGLSRVRRMDLNDAHIFCTPEQIEDEIVGVVQLIEDIYKVLGIRDHWYRLSLWDPNDKEKYVDNPEMWERGDALPPGGHGTPRSGVRRRARRGGVLRAEDRHPAPRSAGPQRDDLDDPGRFPPAQPVPARIRGRGRQVPPAGHGPSRRDRHAGADDRVPDRAVRRGVPALAGAGPGAWRSRSPIGTWSTPSR